MIDILKELYKDLTEEFSVAIMDTVSEEMEEVGEKFNHLIS